MGAGAVTIDKHKQNRNDNNTDTMGRLLSPTPSSSSEGSARDASAAAANPSSGSGGASTRNFKASQAASIAAVVEATNAHRDVIPGLAELMGGSSVAEMMSVFKSGGNAGGKSSSDVSHTRIMNANDSSGGGDGDDAKNAMDLERATVKGHPSLPSVDLVGNAVSKSINEYPPFMTMSTKDSAPQLQLEDPPPVVVESAADRVSPSNSTTEKSGDKSNSSSSDSFQRKLVVKGGMKGYRMSRATHGATSGCYYYEAVVLDHSHRVKGGRGSGQSSERGVKRSHQEMEAERTTEETKNSSDKNDVPAMPEETKSNGGHLRIGWSTRSADLQAPVGYNEHSYGIRDIMGSRIHKSRREDKWGGIGFGPGDVVGVAISLEEKKPVANSATSKALGDASTGIDNAEKKKDKACQILSEDAGKSTSTLTNHIRFFKNGKPMGNGIAFGNIQPETYYPSVSCYMNGSAQLNFGPHFVYPPEGVPAEVNLHPISELCKSPPLPDEVVETVMSSGGGKDGKKVFFSKRTDDSIVSAFKELVKMEATARHDAYSKHLDLHRKEVMYLRKGRGLPTLDLEA